MYAYAGVLIPEHSPTQLATVALAAAATRSNAPFDQFETDGWWLERDLGLTSLRATAALERLSTRQPATEPLLRLFGIVDTTRTWRGRVDMTDGALVARYSNRGWCDFLRQELQHAGGVVFALIHLTPTKESIDAPAQHQHRR